MAEPTENISEQTRCSLFGHSYSLWKEGGKSYMRCDYCPAVRHIESADDLKPRHSQVEMRPMSQEDMLEFLEHLHNVKGTL